MYIYISLCIITVWLHVHSLPLSHGVRWPNTFCLVTRSTHDDVIKWKHVPRYWPFVWGIHRSPANSPHKGQRRRALMFSLICVWINGWVNNREAGDLRRHRAHCVVIVMNHCDAKAGFATLNWTHPHYHHNWSELFSKMIFEKFKYFIWVKCEHTNDILNICHHHIHSRLLFIAFWKSSYNLIMSKWSHAFDISYFFL